MHSVKSFRRLIRIKQNNVRIQKMDVAIEPVTCKHCGNVYVGRFCPNCGQKANIRRFTIGGIIDETIGLFTNFDHTFLRTLVELFYRPGYMIRDYMEGHRVCYFKPMQLLAFMTTLYLAVTYMMDFNVEDTFNFSANISSDEASGSAEEIKQQLANGQFHQWLKKIYNAIKDNELLTTLGAVILFAIPARFCFRKTPYGSQMNLTEHFYARIYMSCQALVVKTLFLPFDHYKLDSITDWRMLLIAALTVWDYAQLMGIRKRRSLRLCIATFCLMFLLIVLLFLPVVILIYFLVGDVQI